MDVWRIFPLSLMRTCSYGIFWKGSDRTGSTLFLLCGLLLGSVPIKIGTGLRVVVHVLFYDQHVIHFDAQHVHLLSCQFQNQAAKSLFCAIFGIKKIKDMVDANHFMRFSCVTSKSDDSFLLRKLPSCEEMSITPLVCLPLRNPGPDE